MKNITTIIAALVLTTLSINTFAQASTDTETANATAKIVSPIALDKAGDLAFGKIAASAAVGTVTLSTTGARTSTGGVSLIASTIGVTTFTATGEAGATYAITLPTSVIVKTSDNANDMTINGFNHSITGTPTLTGGTQVFTVGGTLNVKANQVAGDYTGTYDVTVAYN